MTMTIYSTTYTVSVGVKKDLNTGHSDSWTHNPFSPEAEAPSENQPQVAGQTGSAQEAARMKTRDQAKKNCETGEAVPQHCIETTPGQEMSQYRGKRGQAATRGDESGDVRGQRSLIEGDVYCEGIKQSDRC